MERIVLVMVLFALPFASPKASSITSTLAKTPSFFVTDQREEISPEDLPKKVVQAVLDSEETNGRVVSKVFKVTESDGTVHYEIKFGTEEESLIKKYDEKGKEITD
ncbi:hypothetical protein FKX85_05980 [Echinicola soli]|uniref:PepSY domain-containing protein n=1 Tax=Echinicola soli TaxID=2591634 RepID=A0A514CFK6_9BACT|nr:hypothetical protein [Echinicola soli]QDH78603.1 hypothetical protein FKX85_05980 [Echinicola soli]